MRALTIATREFTGLLVDRYLWLVGAALTVLVTSGVASVNVGIQESLGAARAIAGFQAPVYLFGGLTACLLSYRAVVGDRESGRLKLLLGFSATRRDVTLGTYAGRMATVLTMFALPIVVGGIIGFLLQASAAPLRLLLFTSAAVLYLTALTGIGIGASLVGTTSIRTAAMTFGAYLGFFLFWESIVARVTAAAGISPDSPQFFAALRVSPLNAFQALTNIALGAGNSAGPYEAVYRVTKEGMRTNIHVAATALDTIPVYLQGWVSGLALLAWATVPPLLGYLCFRRTDLD